MPRKAITGPFGRIEEGNGHAVAKLALTIFQTCRKPGLPASLVPMKALP